MLNLLPPVEEIAADVQRALAEDVGDGDLTASLVPAEAQAVARVICREPTLVCGQAWFEAVFDALDSSIEINWAVADGVKVPADTMLCKLTGPARALLTGERAALNFLQTLSATATLASRYADVVEDTHARMLDTRKTIPGLRLAQKYAVACGGCDNHRKGLYDAILIKENHIAAAGSITAAVTAARDIKQQVRVEVEVENLDELREAIAAKADMVLLDNFSLDMLREAVVINQAADHRLILEASGNVTLDTVHAIAETGVDYISSGALTKDVKAIDLSMRFE